MPLQQGLSFTGPAGQIEGMLHLPDIEPRGIAVVAHPLPTMGGTMDNKVVTTLAKTFAEMGYAALRFNFRGAGASAGHFDHGIGETQDAIAAARLMRDNYPDLPLLCAGFSFGGYVQARAAQELHPRQMVLIAPAVERDATPPVPAGSLLIHGDLDDVVELDTVLRWARPQQLAVVVLAGAGHFFHGRLAQLRQVVSQHSGLQS